MLEGDGQDHDPARHRTDGVGILASLYPRTGDLRTDLLHGGLRALELPASDPDLASRGREAHRQAESLLARPAENRHPLLWIRHR